MRWLGLLARLVVGGVWLYAGAIKLPHPEASVTAVRAYQLLPTDFADTVGHVLPIIEVILGVLLILGVFTRSSGLLSALLQVGFIVGIASVWSRGISIDCGCFGDGGANPDAIKEYPWVVARDIGLFAASALLVWRPHTALSLDSVLFPSRKSEVPDGQEEP